MSAAVGIINEVELALRDASSAKRVDALRRITDLFVGDAEKLSPDQTALFDDVLGQLINHITSRAIVELSSRLATTANAPRKTVGHLARHDDIEVSGPILSRSDTLTDADLVDIAKTMSQAHLAKIAGRSRLSEIVTDVLVDEGDADVANELAINLGAKFSQLGMAKLVLRADGDDRLTESIGHRPDLSTHLYRQLVAQATEAVRAKLLAAASPERQAQIRQVLADISAQVAPRAGAAHHYTAAQRAMRPHIQDTATIKRKVLEAADMGQLPEVIVGLSILGSVPIEQVDRLFYAPSNFGLMVLCKAAVFDWPTAGRVLRATPTAGGMAESRFEELHSQYEALSATAAQRIFRFWQSRQHVAKSA